MIIIIAKKINNLKSFYSLLKSYDLKVPFKAIVTRIDPTKRS
jgi:hypothetical protein